MVAWVTSIRYLYPYDARAGSRDSIFSPSPSSGAHAHAGTPFLSHSFAAMSVLRSMFSAVAAGVSGGGAVASTQPPESFTARHTTGRAA